MKFISLINEQSIQNSTLKVFILTHMYVCTMLGSDSFIFQFDKNIDMDLDWGLGSPGVARLPGLEFI